MDVYHLFIMIVVKFLFILFLKSFVNFHFGSLVIIKIRIKGKIDNLMNRLRHNLHGTLGNDK